MVPTMTTRVYIDGQIHDEHEATVSVFDRGFLYGDSVYEVLRTAGGNPVDLDAHLDRLSRSASGLALDIPSHALLRDAVLRTIGATDNKESRIRIIVTRGQAGVGLELGASGNNTTIVIASPLILPDPTLYQSGVMVQIVTVERVSRQAVDPGVKSGNYLNNILALHQARENNAYEAIMCDNQGWVAEGSTSNIFIVENGTLLTPAKEVGLLAGITRETVIRIATQNGIPNLQTMIHPAQLRDADEAFLTSSVRGVLPVAGVNGAAFRNPCPGPVTNKLAQFYENYLAQFECS